MKILVVDDSKYLRNVIRKELAPSEYEILEAENGEVALNIIKCTPNIDLITLDMDMPIMTGFEFLSKIHEPEMVKELRSLNNSSIPVIIVTSNDTAEDRDQGFENGAANFITKPFTSGELLAAVDIILSPSEVLKELSILVVDDSYTSRKFVTTSLKQLGVTIYEADDGDVAFEILKKMRNSIDLVVSDLLMNKMDGDVLCEKIRNELGMKQIPIIILTSSSKVDIKIRLFRAGATDYFVKPFIKEEFIARMYIHLEKQKLGKVQKHAIDQLKKLNKTKDNFLAVCSHDLRAPLNGILGFTDILLEKRHPLLEQKAILTQIKESGEYLLELINDILDLSSAEAKKSNLKMEPVKIVELIKSSIYSLLNTATSKRIKMNFINNTNSPIINANKNSILRIINNFLSNAIKFTKSGGDITITMNSIEDSTKLEIIIADTGIGIPKENIPKLFNKFSDTSRSGTAGEKSTGLGLAITKELIEAHDGDIEVSSVVGEGTTFIITFPADFSEYHIETPPSPQISEAQYDASVKKGSYTILLAEDTYINIKLTTALLDSFGVDVIVAENGKEAVEFFKMNLHKQLPDLILMDIQMPEMNGRDATIEIRKMEKEYNETNNRKLHTPIIAMTAHNSESVHENLIVTGMDDIIVKPVKRGFVEKIIAEYLH